MAVPNITHIAIMGPLTLKSLLFTVLFVVLLLFSFVYLTFNKLVLWGEKCFVYFGLTLRSRRQRRDVTKRPQVIYFQ